MSNKFRKVLAAILAGTMVLGSGVVANADEGSGKGTGSVDVVEAEDIFSVVLPTSAGTQFNYILDPTGVIAKTNFEKYGGTASASFIPDQTMYFRQQPASGNNVATYSNISDPIKAYNKSTMAVEIQVKAHLATPSGIIISTSSVANENIEKATPSIYLAVADGNGTPIEAITTTDRVVATSSLGDAKANYKVVYATDSKTYKISLATGSTAKTDAELTAANFDCYSFTLTGDCNPKGKWIGLTENPPEVTLVWKINKPDGAAEVGNYTDTTAHGNWSGATLWLGKDADTGFSTTGLKVEVSDGGTNYSTLAADKYEISDAGWVGITWDNIAAGIGSAPTKIYVRVTDGTTRYVFEDN